MGFSSLRWIDCFLLVLALEAPAFADGSHDRTQFGHGEHHFRAQVLIVIGGCNREIALAESRPVAQIVCFPARVPPSLFGVDVVKAILLALIEADVVEDEKLGFRSEIGCIRDAAGTQIHLRFASNKARIAIIGLFCDWIDDVTHQHQRGHLGEGIEQMAVRVRLQHHGLCRRMHARLRQERLEVCPGGRGQSLYARNQR